VLAGLVAMFLAGARPAMQGQAGASYTVISTEGRRALPFRPGAPEMIALDQLSGLFGLKFTEDTLAGGLLIETRGQRILAVPGQSFVQAAGRVVQLSGPVVRERNNWQVPIDFLTQALGPAIGQRIVIRRPSRLILVGDVRVPQVNVRAEKPATRARVIVEIQPATPHRVTREGNRLVVRFEATAIDPGPITAQVPDFVTGANVVGTTLTLTLGASAVDFKADDDRDETHLTIDLLPAPPPPPPPTPATPAPGAPGVPARGQDAPPAIDLTPGTIRTVVIDPGHGGDDEGARGPGGTKEKDFTLNVARRLKAAIESRMGLRVIMTRSADEAVPLDRRTALANNNKADVFISLHANASVRPTVRGAQVLSLSLEDYPASGPAADPRRNSAPLIDGSLRNLEPVPWDLAQLPYAGRSAALGAILIQHFTERSVPLYTRPSLQMPMRVLVGANMPAVLIEMGFLSNPAEEKALTGGEVSNAIIDAIAITIGEVRRGIPDLAAKRGGQ